jgi:hypothetical protein
MVSHAGHAHIQEREGGRLSVLLVSSYQIVCGLAPYHAQRSRHIGIPQIWRVAR